VLLFWESGGEEKKFGADFRFKSQQRNFGEIRKFLVKSEGNELPFRQEKTRKWRAQISVNAIKIRTTESNPVANNGNDHRRILSVGFFHCGLWKFKELRCVVLARKKVGIYEVFT
jgi:hypothetical protein